MINCNGWTNGSSATDDLAPGSSTGNIANGDKEDETSTDPWDQAIARLQIEEKNRTRQGAIVRDRFRICAKIGVGSFGFVHAGIDEQNEDKMAIKFEFRSDNADHTKLPTEHEIYERLQGKPGVPKVFWYEEDVCGGRYRAMGMELLGPNLNDLFDVCNHYFSLKTTVSLGLQMLDRVQQLHQIGYVHRDIKPENFLIGLDPCRQETVFLVDFGMAKPYTTLNSDGSTGHVLNTARVPGRRGQPIRGTIIGTAPYASINSHNGWTLSRRDDMESLAYMLIYFMKGTLPWKEMKCRKASHKHNLIRNIKTNTPTRDICLAIPYQFEKFLSIARNLRFDEEPPYEVFRELLMSIVRWKRFNMDNMFDWKILLRKDIKLKEHWGYRFRWTVTEAEEAKRYWGV